MWVFLEYSWRVVYPLLAIFGAVVLLGMGLAFFLDGWFRAGGGGATWQTTKKK